MVRLLFTAIAALATIAAHATTVDLPNGLTFDVPDGYTLTSDYPATVLTWSDGTHTIAFATATDSAGYDLDKCLDSYDRAALPLEGYVSYDETDEPWHDLNHDYTERSYYRLSDRLRLITHTGYSATGKPYVLAYTYPAAETPDAFLAAARSVRCGGSWWQRMQLLYSQSMIVWLLFPIVLILASYLVPERVPRGITVVALALFLAWLGRRLWSDPSIALTVYALWAVLLFLRCIVDASTFSHLAKKTDEIIP